MKNIWVGALCAPNPYKFYNKMKKIILFTALLMIVSCHSVRNYDIPQGERYIVFCSDSFDIYYNIETMIHYCEEMNNPQSALYNEQYAKMSHEDFSILKNVCDDVRLDVNYLSLPSFDFNKTQNSLEIDLCAYYSVKDVEYLFYRNRNVLIKKHGEGNFIDDYEIRVKEGIGNDIVEIVNKRNKSLIFSFYWEQWWGQINKRMFKPVNFNSSFRSRNRM